MSKNIITSSSPLTLTDYNSTEEAVEKVREKAAEYNLVMQGIITRLSNESSFFPNFLFKVSDQSSGRSLLLLGTMHIFPFDNLSPEFSNRIEQFDHIISELSSVSYSEPPGAEDTLFVTCFSPASKDSSYEENFRQSIFTDGFSVEHVSNCKDQPIIDYFKELPPEYQNFYKSFLGENLDLYALSIEGLTEACCNKMIANEAYTRGTDTGIHALWLNKKGTVFGLESMEERELIGLKSQYSKYLESGQNEHFSFEVYMLMQIIDKDILEDLDLDLKEALERTFSCDYNIGEINSGEQKELNEADLIQRNELWHPRIKKAVDILPGKTLIFCGSLHLFGEKGLLNKLESDGFCTEIMGQDKFIDYMDACDLNPELA